MNAVLKPVKRELDEELSGIAYGIPAEAYFADSALNKSTLAAFADLDDQGREETAAMSLGSLAHCAILEPDELMKRYHVTDIERRGTKDWAAVEEEAAGRKVVKREDFDAALLMARSIQESEAHEFLHGAKFEASVFWIDPVTGLRCKCRPDILGAQLADLKTTQSVKLDKFSKKVFDLRYDWADAWYLEGLAANGLDYDRMVFIAVENKAKLLAGSVARKHAVGLFEINPEDREIARRQIERWRGIYAYSVRNDIWPEPEQTIQTIIRPKWAITEEE